MIFPQSIPFPFDFEKEEVPVLSVEDQQIRSTFLLQKFHPGRSQQLSCLREFLGVTFQRVFGQENSVPLFPKMNGCEPFGEVVAPMVLILCVGKVSCIKEAWMLPVPSLVDGVPLPQREESLRVSEGDLAH